MGFHTRSRPWSSLLVVCVPASVLACVWALFLGGQRTVALLAVAYLLIVITGRGQAVRRERRDRPYREERVQLQVERVCSTLFDL